MGFAFYKKKPGIIRTVVFYIVAGLVIDIGMIMADDQQMFVKPFLEYCETNGLRNQLELISSSVRRFPGLLTPGFAKGILYVGNISGEVSEFIRKNPDYPIVTVNEVSPYCVCPDFESGTKRAVQYLVAHGHRRIAMSYVTGTNYAKLQQIARAELSCWDKLNLDRSSDLLKPFGYRSSGLPDCTTEWICEMLDRKNPPTAFFFSGMQGARKLVYEAMKRGLRIPEDISVISVGHEWESICAYPEISSVEQDFCETAMYALQMLQRRISGMEIPEPQLTTETKLILRSSTK